MLKNELLGRPVAALGKIVQIPTQQPFLLALTNAYLAVR